MRKCPIFISIVKISGAWKGTHGNGKTVLKMRKYVKGHTPYLNSTLNPDMKHNVKSLLVQLMLRPCAQWKTKIQHYSKGHEEDKVSHLEI